MRSPKLTRKLALQASYRQRDDAGGYSTLWQTLGELWAEIRHGTGSDAEAAGLSVSQVPYRITVRAAPVGSESRPVPGMRLRDGTRYFEVLAVTEADAGARYLTVFAREEEVTA